MLVTFHSESAGDVTLFGDVAVALLRMSGHSGSIPGAILAGDLPGAIGRLKSGVAALQSPEGPPREASPDATLPGPGIPVSLRLRAGPLIELLSASAQRGSDVLWESGAPVL